MTEPITICSSIITGVVGDDPILIIPSLPKFAIGSPVLALSDIN